VSPALAGARDASPQTTSTTSCCRRARPGRYGSTIVYYATNSDAYYLRQQLIFAAGGLVVMAAISLVDYDTSGRWHWCCTGSPLRDRRRLRARVRVVRWSRRWIDLGIVPFQALRAGIVCSSCLWAPSRGPADRRRRDAYARCARPTGSGGRWSSCSLTWGTATTLVMVGLGVLFFFAPADHFASSSAHRASPSCAGGHAGHGMHCVKSYPARPPHGVPRPTHDTSAPATNQRRS